VRGFMPGFAYQVGALISASAPYIQTALTHSFTYAQVMGTFAAIVMILGTFIVGFGPEAHRITFGRHESG